MPKRKESGTTRFSCEGNQERLRKSPRSILVSSMILQKGERLKSLRKNFSNKRKKICNQKNDLYKRASTLVKLEIFDQIRVSYGYI